MLTNTILCIIVGVRFSCCSHCFKKGTEVDEPFFPHPWWLSYCLKYICKCWKRIHSFQEALPRLLVHWLKRMVTVCPQQLPTHHQSFGEALSEKLQECRYWLLTYLSSSSGWAGIVATAGPILWHALSAVQLLRSIELKAANFIVHWLAPRVSMFAQNAVFRILLASSCLLIFDTFSLKSTRGPSLHSGTEDAVYGLKIICYCLDCMYAWFSVAWFSSFDILDLFPTKYISIMVDSSIMPIVTVFSW